MASYYAKSVLYDLSHTVVWSIVRVRSISEINVNKGIEAGPEQRGSTMSARSKQKLTTQYGVAQQQWPLINQPLTKVTMVLRVPYKRS